MADPLILETSPDDRSDSERFHSMLGCGSCLCYRILRILREAPRAYLVMKLSDVILSRKALEVLPNLTLTRYASSVHGSLPWNCT